MCVDAHVSMGPLSVKHLTPTPHLSQAEKPQCGVSFLDGFCFCFCSCFFFFSITRDLPEAVAGAPPFQSLPCLRITILKPPMHSSCLGYCGVIRFVEQTIYDDTCESTDTLGWEKQSSFRGCLFLSSFFAGLRCMEMFLVPVMFGASRIEVRGVW